MNRSWLALFAAVLVACNPGGTPQSSFNLTPFVEGLSSPVYLTHAKDGSSDLYVVEQGGTVRVIEAGKVRSQAFLNVTNQISNGGEQGLLSIAFHPNYAQNGFVFAYYTDLNGDLQVSRFTANRAAKTVDVGTEKKVLNVAHPGQSNHNGGQLQFGPDGFLYAATGDGGGGGDPNGNAVNTSSLLGKMLRLDVNVPDSSPTPYAIPDGNPFKNGGGRGEIWSYGLRNPWRFSFDRQTGDIWIGDVGQGAREEVDFEPKNTPGRNYGWNKLEGSQCYAANTCDKTGLTLPVFDYGRDLGSTVVGGFVYRGSAASKMVGTYVLADAGSGNFWTLVPSGGTFSSKLEGKLQSGVVSFGEDAIGELYAINLGGSISKITWK